MAEAKKAKAKNKQPQTETLPLFAMPNGASRAKPETKANEAAAPKKITNEDFPPDATASEKLKMMGILYDKADRLIKLGASGEDFAKILDDLELKRTSREEEKGTEKENQAKSKPLSEKEHMEHAMQAARGRILEEKPEPIQPTKERFGDLNSMMLRLMKYSDERVRHFGKAQRVSGLGRTINNRLDKMSLLICECTIYNPEFNRETALRDCCAVARSLNQSIETAFREKLIQAHHFDAWVNLVVPMDNLMLSMAIYLQDLRQGKGKKKKK